MSTYNICFYGEIGLLFYKYHLLSGAMNIYLDKPLIWRYVSSLNQIAKWESPHADTLTLSMLGINFSQQYFEIFFLIFGRKQALTFHAHCLLCLFSENKKKNICHLLKLPVER